MSPERPVRRPLVCWNPKVADVPTLGWPGLGGKTGFSRTMWLWGSKRGVEEGGNFQMPGQAFFPVPALVETVQQNREVAFTYPLGVE